MPLTIEEKPEDAELTGRGAEDGLLELVIGSASRPLTAEAGYLKELGLVSSLLMS